MVWGLYSYAKLERLRARSAVNFCVLDALLIDWLINTQKYAGQKIHQIQ